MAKTAEELQKLKDKIEALDSEMAELTDEELDQVTGGEMSEAESKFREAVARGFQADLQRKVASGEITAARAKSLIYQFEAQADNAKAVAKEGRRNTTKEANSRYERELWKNLHGYESTFGGTDS